MDMDSSVQTQQQVLLFKVQRLTKLTKNDTKSRNISIILIIWKEALFLPRASDLVPHPCHQCQSQTSVSAHLRNPTTPSYTSYHQRPSQARFHLPTLCPVVLSLCYTSRFLQADSWSRQWSTGYVAGLDTSWSEGNPDIQKHSYTPA